MRPVAERQVILITGGARRLGRLLAIDLAERNHRIAIHYHQSEKEAQSLARALQKKKRTIALFQANLCRVGEIERMVANIIGHFGRIDVLINNAAIFYETPFGAIQESDWDYMLDTNLKGPFFCAQAVGRQMLKQKGDRKRYKIINITDSGGPRTRANYLPYWISKAGLAAMTETLATIFTPGIQVNAIAPGPLLFAEDRDRLKNQMPIPPREIAEGVRYLIEKATFVTGNTLVIDGGRRYR